jgi:hypothetical protein
MLYLVTCDVERKWTMRIPHWGQILAQLSVYFPERMTPQIGSANSCLRPASHSRLDAV